jgi:soluble lytic murein transglycosylase-like protein
MIDLHSRRQAVEPALVRAVIQAESDFDRRALSAKGAMGLMQLMPETARELGVSDPWDPDQNIDGGTRYLRQLLDRFGGDLAHALAGYNAGPSAVERYGGVPPYAETTAYVDRVLGFYRGRAEVAVRRAAETQTAATPAAYRPVRVERQADGTVMLVTRD